MVKIGMIGLGKMGISHYGIVNPHRDADVVAICDSSRYVADAVAARTGAKTFSDYRKMIDACALDAVIVSTPTASHMAIAEYAIANGLHVFLEKPLTLSANDSQELARTADAKSIVNQVGYINRFNAVFVKAKRLLDSGALGAIHHFTASMRGNVVTKPIRSSWRSKKESGGGCLYEYGSHCIDLVHFMLGEPSAVVGSRMKRIFSSDVEDAVYTTFMYDHGPSGHVSVNWCDPAFRKAANFMEFAGSNGSLQIGKQDCRLFLRNSTSNLPEGWSVWYQTDLVRPVDFFVRGEDYSEQLDHFIKCICDRSVKAVCTFADAAMTDRVMQLIRSDAAEEGK